MFSPASLSLSTVFVFNQKFAQKLLINVLKNTGGGLPFP